MTLVSSVVFPLVFGRYLVMNETTMMLDYVSVSALVITVLLWN